MLFASGVYLFLGPISWKSKDINLAQISHSVRSSSLWSHGWQHARLPCPSPTPRAPSNSCALSQLCHETISSSVVPFSSFQSFPASGSFLMSQFFASDGQSIGTSASASVLLMNIQDWFSLGWTVDLLAVQGTLKSLLQHQVQKHQFFGAWPSIWSNSHICTWLLGKP